MSSQPPRLRWPRRLWISCASFACALVALEIAARVQLGEHFVFGVYVGSPQAILGEFDPDLGWRSRARASARIALAGRTYSVTLNSRGQRGPERAETKPPGVKRVVVLGDSTSWGWGVDDDLMWTRLVERALGPGVELINLAVPGYGTDQELWVLESVGLRYQPDVVLLGFVHNDTLYNGSSDMQGMRKPMFARAEDGTWIVAHRPVPEPAANSELGQRRLRRLLSMYFASVRWLEPAPAKPTRYALDDLKVQAGIERYWSTVLDASSPTHHALAALAQVCRASNTKLAVFHFPHLVDRWLYDPTTPLPAREAGVPYTTFGTRVLAEAARELGFESFSIDQALYDVVRTGVSLDCGDEHLNERGNAVVAQVVAARLRELLGLP